MARATWRTIKLRADTTLLLHPETVARATWRTIKLRADTTLLLLLLLLLVLLLCLSSARRNVFSQRLRSVRTNRQDRQTDRQADRQQDRQTSHPVRGRRRRFRCCWCCCCLPTKTFYCTQPHLATYPGTIRRRRIIPVYRWNFFFVSNLLLQGYTVIRT